MKSTMTIELQRKYIEDERRIIENIQKRKPVAEYNMLYISDLEEKIRQREAWIETSMKEDADGLS